MEHRGLWWLSYIWAEQYGNHQTYILSDLLECDYGEIEFLIFCKQNSIELFNIYVCVWCGVVCI